MNTGTTSVERVNPAEFKKAQQKIGQITTLRGGLHNLLSKFNKIPWML
jgi:hypothetical protein